MANKTNTSVLRIFQTNISAPYKQLFYSFNPRYDCTKLFCIKLTIWVGLNKWSMPNVCGHLTIEHPIPKAYALTWSCPFYAAITSSNFLKMLFNSIIEHGCENLYSFRHRDKRSTATSNHSSRKAWHKALNSSSLQMCSVGLGFC